MAMLNTFRKGVEKYIVKLFVISVAYCTRWCTINDNTLVTAGFLKHHQKIIYVYLSMKLTFLLENINAILQLMSESENPQIAVSLTRAKRW